MFYKDESVWHLRRVRLFTNLTPEELREKADRLYFVHKGSVKISILSSSGEERILDILRAGDLRRRRPPGSVRGLCCQDNSTLAFFV